MINLRPYQREAVSKLVWSQRLEGADLCILPTGAGKSVVIAELVRQINKPILILQPTKEILEQNYEKLKQIVPVADIGIYSASMNEKTINTFTLATIQSIYNYPEKFTHFTVVIIDECHLVNPTNLEGMYTQFFKEIGNPKVYGMTATAFRMAKMWEKDEDGNLISHTTTKIITRLKERFWHRIMFNLNMQELIDLGYLVPLKYIDRKIIDHAQIPTNITGSDFDMGAYERLIKEKEVEVLEAVFFGMELGKSVLVFCSSIDQAEHLSKVIEGSAVVTGKTPKRQRTKIVTDFKNGLLKVVFNVGVLTTGFDHPALDCIVLLRPTQSIGLYSQMLGRGVRKAEGKKFCYVIDMTGTVETMGRVETIRLEKQDKWELISEKGSWHYKPLYSHRVISRIAKLSDPNPFL